MSLIGRLIIAILLWIAAFAFLAVMAPYLTFSPFGYNLHVETDLSGMIPAIAWFLAGAPAILIGCLWRAAPFWRRLFAVVASLVVAYAVMTAGAFVALYFFLYSSAANANINVIWLSLLLVVMFLSGFLTNRLMMKRNVDRPDRT